jgi:hypothetical protein
MAASDPIAEAYGHLLSAGRELAKGEKLDVKREAIKALEALADCDKMLLAYFCEWLVLNRAIANTGGSSPIESASAIATSVHSFVVQNLPENDFKAHHAIYLEMTKSAWELGYPQLFFQFEPKFQQSISDKNGS